MNFRNKHRLAALLAFVIGMVTIVEGGLVLLGFVTNENERVGRGMWFFNDPWLLR